MVPMKNLVAKGGKKRSRRCTLDCTYPLELIMDAANFEQLLQERARVNRKAGNLSGGVVTFKRSKITVTSEGYLFSFYFLFLRISFFKRYLKYITKNYLKKNNQYNWLYIVAKSK
ncbi:large ribosomal subunit protein eL22-like [Eulemur rufifrons]|uniref:large ribosomal subunit protein eL22-like n=1 Tax=Eulemur rufifrons TaxID=859984 RepID=UPI00374276DB